MNDSPDLVILRRAGIEGPAQKQFSDDATQRPHINCLTEWQAKNDFRCTIIARLKVCVAYGLADVRCTSEVDNFHSAKDIYDG